MGTLNRRRYTLLGMACLGLYVLLLTSCAQNSQEPFTLQGPALGTSYSLIAFGPDGESIPELLDSVMDAVNASMSTYQENSLISRWNRGERIRPDKMFNEVLEISADVYRESQGAFDPTVGVLVNAWGFGTVEAGVPDSTEVDSLLRYVGFSKVRIGPDGYLVRDEPGIQLDFNAVAKGYALDRVGLVLEELGCTDYMFELGGEIRVRGINRSKGKPWTIGIEDPIESELGARSTRRLIRLRTESMASSGNYRKFRVDTITGEKYVHTIDPRTGFTRNSNILATSVIAENCALADAFATAFMAMELEQSEEILQHRKDLEGYIIYLDQENKVHEFFTPGFKERLFSPGVQ